MSSSPQNQIQALVVLQQTNCADVWSKHGLSNTERHEKLEEFKRMLQSTYDDFSQSQLDEAESLQNEIHSTRDQITMQLSRLGVTIPLPPLSGTLKDQYSATTEKYQEVLEKVKQREKQVFSLTTSIRKLCNQLQHPVPPECSIESNGPQDLSQAFTTTLQQQENELRDCVDKNFTTLQTSLPYLIYYLREMNLYHELTWIYQAGVTWTEEGNYIKEKSHFVGSEVSEVLSSSYQFTQFDHIIQQNVNLAAIPTMKQINILRQQQQQYQQQQQQHTKANSRRSLVEINLNMNKVNTTNKKENNNDGDDDEITFIFQQYEQFFDYHQFPLDVPFIQELQQKVMQLQIMHRDRSEFSLTIGDKIRNLWELTETNEDESAAWIESCCDLSLITLRTFQKEFIRLCEEKSRLLPQWIANHEKMLQSLCKSLGMDQNEVDRKLKLSRTQYTLDDQLETLRAELGQLQAELSVRQPILDKIAAFNTSCHAVDELKTFENHPDRFKDAKIRSRLDRLRKDCKALPQKAAILYSEILSFESTHGDLCTSGQRVAVVLEQNEFWEQARRQGLVNVPRPKKNEFAMSSNPLINQANAGPTPAKPRVLGGVATKSLNQTRIGGGVAAATGTRAPVGGVSTVKKTTTSDIQRGASKPVPAARRFSREMPANTTTGRIGGVRALQQKKME